MAGARGSPACRSRPLTPPAARARARPPSPGPTTSPTDSPTSSRAAVASSSVCPRRSGTSTCSTATTTVTGRRVDLVARVGVGADDLAGLDVVVGAVLDLDLEPDALERRRRLGVGPAPHVGHLELVARRDHQPHRRALAAPGRPGSPSAKPMTTPSSTSPLGRATSSATSSAASSSAVASSPVMPTRPAGTSTSVGPSDTTTCSVPALAQRRRPRPGGSRGPHPAWCRPPGWSRPRSASRSSAIAAGRSSRCMPTSDGRHRVRRHLRLHVQPAAHDADGHATTTTTAPSIRRRRAAVARRHPLRQPRAAGAPRRRRAVVRRHATRGLVRRPAAP